MSNYTKTTDFEAKDSLPTGDSGKIIRGAEFETEFDAIATAIATKADTAGPTFTGTLTFDTISDGTISIGAFVDEDDMSSNSAVLVPTQQSVKAYVDAQVTAQDLDFQGDSGGALSIDLDSETMTIAGGTGINTSGSGNTLTISVDSSVSTITGSDTLTNKNIDADNNTISNLEVDNFKAAAIVIESEGIGSNDNDTTLPTSAAVKDYVDSQTTAQDLDFQADSGGALSIDLDSETMTFTGGTGIDTSGSENAVTFAIDSTVTTLTGSQTLTNKTLTSAVLDTGVSGTAVLDEDDMVSDSATQLATQQSIKAYVDSQVAGADTLAEVLGNGNTTGGTDIAFGDNDKAVFGAGSDLQIYHDPSAGSIIQEAGAGSLFVRASTNIQLEGVNGENMAIFNENGSVQLYHDNAEKLATTSTGIDVTGTVTADGLTVDKANGSLITLNATNAGTPSNHIKFSDADGDTAFVGFISNSTDNLTVYNATATGDIELRTNALQRLNIDGATGDISFYEDTGTTAKLFWDASAEALGIGTSSPDRLLHLNTGTTGAITPLLRLEGQFTSNTGNEGTAIEFITGSGGTEVGARIIATREAAGARGALRFCTGRENDAGFDDGNVVIDESGNLLVGTTSAVVANSSSNVGTVIGAGLIESARAGVVAQFNRHTSDGSIVDFQKDGTTVGSIGVNSSVIPYFVRSAGSVGGIALGGGATKKVYPCDTVGAGADDALDLGDSSTRFKDLYLSGGVYVGGTTSANQLDDYEEGTWTPVPKSGTTVITTTVNKATYTKIGRYVFVQGYITRNDAASLSGQLNISGLPFNTQSGNVSANGSFWIDGTGTDEVCTGYFAGSTDIVTLKKVGANSDYVTADQFQNGRPIYFSAAYMTAT